MKNGKRWPTDGAGTKYERESEYVRLRREARYLVEYALTLVKNWSYYDSSHDMNFLDAVVRILGTKKDYEKFSSFRMRSDYNRKDQTVIASR